MCLLLGGVAALFVPLLRPMISGEIGSDYPAHVENGRVIWESRRLTLPHFLYHGVVIVYQQALKRSLPGQSGYELPGLLAAVSFYALLALVLYVALRRRLARLPGRGGLFAAFAALSLMVAGHIPLLAALDHRNYLGYIGINVYHNPTVVSVKPIALLLFWYAVWIFQPGPGNGLRYAGAAALSVLSALAKPSHLICLLPALVLCAAYQRVRGRRVDIGLLVAGFLIPAVLVFAWQYRMVYGGGGDQRVIFAPLRAMSAHSDYLLPKLLLSVVFPGCVYVAYFRQARGSLRLNLAWMVFLVGLVYAYFVTEFPRVDHGNFVWGAMITLFVLFVESALFLLEQRPQTAQGTLRDRRLTLCAAAYGLHLIGGIYYYLFILLRRQVPPDVHFSYG